MEGPARQGATVEERDACSWEAGAEGQCMEFHSHN